ncbi:MAG: alpha/beta hydrolase-fold protein [Paracoccus sp. (in: a-proteobacteria)]|uniref:alpha/beta hydrolase-fold protein n=1 Tax=Paracoccus sp. TaxID=267 RepID=UPI0026DEA666|nr:alpha/beta hydrolase-fold protein [Paracoccus sp. (in: a-proteobacteria)]MDO5622818.1 alpha/beta hydrolase-fold protein [Paracoccus sp. (in: a-proteobacteria)]
MLLVSLMLASQATAQQLLQPGEPLSLQLDQAGAEQLRIDAVAGSYVVGVIKAEGMIDANLRNKSGQHFRQLADDKTGEMTFRFIAPDDAPALELTGNGTAVIELRQVVAPDAQRHAVEAVNPGYESRRIAALAAVLDGGGSSDAFWQEIAEKGTPLIEDAGDGEVILTFLWRGATRNVRLFGGPSNDHEWLDQLGDSDVWFKSFRVPDRTRLSYQLAPDVPEVPGSFRDKRAALLATAQMDPLNKYPWPVDAPDRFNQKATVSLPDAPPQPGTPPTADAVPILSELAFESELLGNSRRITLSHPRNFDPKDPRLVTLFVFDGERAMDELDLPHVLDSLTRDGVLPPVLTVMIPSIDSDTRARELPGNPVFADALADELLPLVSLTTGIAPDPARTAVTGVSYGGLAAATVPFHRSDIFGNGISLSGSFWWAPDRNSDRGIPYVAAEYAAAPKLPVRFFISAGDFENARDGNFGILETSRAMRDILRLKGYEVSWREYAAGHDYFAWRGAVADGMIALFGK